MRKLKQATTQDVTAAVGKSAASVSAEMNRLEKIGFVKRNGTVPVTVKRFGKDVQVMATLWALDE